MLKWNGCAKIRSLEHEIELSFLKLHEIVTGFLLNTRVPAWESLTESNRLRNFDSFRVNSSDDNLAQQEGLEQTEYL